LFSVTHLATLAATAASIGFVHTVLGPDHYLPFVALSKAKWWSRLKTVMVTLLCGIGHVGSSVVIGLVGVGFGLALFKIEAAESFRGELAAWALTAFGLIYLVWGLRRARRKISHGHLSDAERQKEKGGIAIWSLFIVFVLGPCEPLIPLMMYPVALGDNTGALFVVITFSAATISTMIVTVLILTFGLRAFRVPALERYSHALAGFAILLCGIAIHIGL
jgi:nickel/cobalt exporter